MELFQQISDSYNDASYNLEYWYDRSHILTKIVSFLWVYSAMAVMELISLFFLTGVIFDELAIFLDKLRVFFKDELTEASNAIEHQKRSYISTPIIAAIIAPFVLLAGITPKWSSVVTDAAIDREFRFGTAHGFFTQMCKLYIYIPGLMLRYAFKHDDLFFIVGVPLAFAVLPFAWCIATVFMLLIVLDWLSWLVEMIRLFVVNSSSALAKRSGNNGLSALFCPTLRAILLPVYIVLLIIPKISSQSDG